MVRTVLIDLDIGHEHIRLSFLIFHDPSSGRYFIKFLDFSVDSEGKTIKECKENIQEAILIHFEDCQASCIGNIL